MVPEKALAAYELDTLIKIEMHSWLMGELEVSLLQLMSILLRILLAVSCMNRSGFI